MGVGPQTGATIVLVSVTVTSRVAVARLVCVTKTVTVSRLVCVRISVKIVELVCVTIAVWTDVAVTVLVVRGVGAVMVDFVTPMQEQALE